MVHGVGAVRPNFHFEDCVLGFARYAFDGDADAREILRKAAVVNWNIDEIANPLCGKFHSPSIRTADSSPLKAVRNDIRLPLCLADNQRPSAVLPKLLQKSHISLKE